MVPGEIILLKYKILRILKDAEDSCIFLVEHIDLNSYWIIKKVHVISDKYLKEVELLKGIKHVNVPLLVDVKIEEDALYLVREYIDGMTLDQYIQEKGQINEIEGIQLGIALCKIIEFFHNFPQPIIIRDIKPNNIIIAKDGTLKLIDFSIAKHYEAAAIRDTEYLGTRGFAAIEQFGIIKHAKSDMQTDVFGIGATLYYLFTQKDLGKPPYAFELLTVCRKDLSESLEQILKKACQLKKEDRFRTVGTMREALTALVEVPKQMTLKDFLGQIKIPIIVVQGIKSGIGVTHLCLNLAAYLNQRQCSTCIIDLSENQRLSVLEYQPDAKYTNGVIEYEGIFIIAEKSNSVLNDSKRNLYRKELSLEEQIKCINDQRIVIVDGGTYSSEDEKTLDCVAIRPTQRIMVSGANPWEIELLEECIINECHQNIDYAINLCTQNQVNQLQQSIQDKRFLYIPFIPFEEHAIKKYDFEKLINDQIRKAIKLSEKEEAKWLTPKNIFSRVKKSKIRYQDSTKP